MGTWGTGAFDSSLWSQPSILTRQKVLARESRLAAIENLFSGDAAAFSKNGGNDLGLLAQLLDWHLFVFREGENENRCGLQTYMTKLRVFKGDGPHLNAELEE